ncbi:substrate-binding domain-containing protein [Conexibacter sp. CPCC 206217]|uniref:substrate-binding domain-containing protein n=1 Tax=Conexibacter sp. CPCC 206217 TaxID=3064574 RepID=UPI00272345C2|nr:substrate-binding domain-containing protein [Conexibacter sp. CPCC 206217]MDO8211693.1 substrate-binding domain-containing protein [Conexibacter sp. CPCC 206217]
MSGAGIGRRELLLRGAAGALAAVWLPPALAGCGAEPEQFGLHVRELAARSIAIDYASYYPPVQELRALVRERAQRVGARVTFSDDAAGAAAQRAEFGRLTSDSSGFRVVAVAPFDAAALDPLAAEAIERGIGIVTYAVSLAHQSATITADPARAGRLLARNAADWAARALPDGGDVLIVRPSPSATPPQPAASATTPDADRSATTPAAPSGAPVADPFAPLARPWESALLEALAARAPQLRAVAATTAQSSADAEAAVARALRDYPGVRVVLSWNDSTAVGAASALRRAHPSGEWSGLYAGGVGAPAIASTASLDALRDDPVLRCLVAPRLRDLANALVDVPLALLRRRRPPTAPVPLTVLTPGASQLRAFARDYRAAG